MGGEWREMVICIETLRAAVEALLAKPNPIADEQDLISLKAMADSAQEVCALLVDQSDQQ